MYPFLFNLLSISFLTGAPGSEKEAHVNKLLKRYPGWEHVNMGRLIKEEISKRGEGHTKWRMVRDLYSKGDAIPEVSFITFYPSALRMVKIQWISLPF